MIPKDWKQLMADCAQEVYDSWDQDADGVDVEFGTGGICDYIAEDTMSKLFQEDGEDCFMFRTEDPNHCSIIVEYAGKHYHMDIPYSAYELYEGPYQFTKIEGVTFTPEDVQVWEASPEDIASIQEEECVA